nr:reverse transcriptase domain-containing protein [Tanacetum cinerariifolium]
MSKYGVTHRLSTAYHPQTISQVEVTNRGLKRILERTVGENRALWTDKLDDSLWAFRKAFKTPIGCTPYRLVYGKSSHLPLELEHKAYWALKHANFDLKTMGDHRKLQLNELHELRDQAYKNSLIYKERTKKLHDSKIKNRIFNVGDQVLLFNSRLKIFSRKLKTRWSGPFTITKVYPYGTAKLSHADGSNFKGTGSGSEPRCPNTTLGDADAQTRFETVSKQFHDLPLSEVNISGCRENSMAHHDGLTDFVPPTPHDSPLSGGHTPGSDEDLVIKRLQKKVKRLEKKQRARTPRMNLFKIGTSRRKILDKENVSKHGRNLKARIKKGDFDDDFDDIDVMVNKAIKNIEGDTVNAAIGVCAASASVTTDDSEVVKDSRKKDDSSQKQAESTKKRPRVEHAEESVKKQKLEDNTKKEELGACLDILPGDNFAINVESLAAKYAIVDWKTQILTENMIEEDEIWKAQQDYNLISWILFDSCGVHVLLMDSGIAIYMMVEWKYPLIQEILSRMLNRRLKIDHERRPFFATARAMIDVFNKKITLRVGDDEVIFDIDQSNKTHPKEDDECYRIDDLDDTVNMETQELLANYKFDLFLLKGLEKSINQSDLESCESLGNKFDDAFGLEKPIRHIDSINTLYSVAQETARRDGIKSEHLYSASANEIDEKKPELKILPRHLEYVYLHGDESFPIIISSKLSKKEKMLLLYVLEKRKRAIARKMSDIMRISPSFCTHNILMEDDFKPVIQPQRRLNPKVQDVVKKEIVKLLDSELIYPISDSSWVSPIHVVPKKGGITIVLNDDNELIPSRFFQIPIAPRDQEKTTFTCPYGTFAYRRILFGLCNAPATFQRCMTEIFHDMVERFMEIFMDDFSVFGAENLAADHLSRLENLDLGAFTEEEITDEFLAVDFISKLVEAQALLTNNARVVIKFLSILFATFGVPKALISDRGTHFYNSQLEKALQKYGVTHKLSTTYYPQTNEQTEVTNRAIKGTLERSVGYNTKNWSEKLDDALWAFRTVYKTPTGCTPFRLVHGKTCHLPVEIEHKAYWALKQCNMDLTGAAKNRFMELNELMELRDGAYENTRIYKERTKRGNDSRL